MFGLVVPCAGLGTQEGCDRSSGSVGSVLCVSQVAERFHSAPCTNFGCACAGFSGDWTLVSAEEEQDKEGINTVR